MTIDPRIGFYLSLALAILGSVAGLGSQLTDVVGPTSAKLILGISFILLTVGNAVNAVLHAIPSASTSDPKVAKEFYLGPGPKP